MEGKELTSEELANNAIEFLELAGKLEDEGKIEEALESYEKALTFLIESGYLPHRIDDIRDHIDQLTQKVDKTEISKRELKKVETNKLQDEAFLLLDQAKKAELDGDFQKAIKRYDSAISMLRESGWSESQLENLRSKRTNLLNNFEKKKQIKTQKIIQYTTQKADRSNLKVDLENIPELKESIYSEEEYEHVKKYYEAQKEENQIKDKAFKLIDEAKDLEREGKFDQAVIRFREVIDLLEIIDWKSYIEPIKNLISRIEEKKQTRSKEREKREKREEQLEELKKSLQKKQEEALEKDKQSKIDIQQRIEKQKEQKAEKEKQLLSILNQADQLIKNKQLQKAVKQYEHALELLRDMGSGWENYIDIVNETIKSVNKAHEAKYDLQYQEQKKKERDIKHKEDFQEFISRKLKLERKRLEEREIELKEKEEEIQHRERLKEKAFELMDQAQEKVMELDFDEAIKNYQKAKEIFSEIQWTDELELIENSIKELQKKKNELLDQKNKQMEQKIKQLREEEKFQTRIRQKLQLERKRLKEREISLEERENELVYQREQKDKALQILDSAQKAVEEGNYDKAIEAYQNAAKIFSTIQWKDEVKLLKNSILQLENKKKEDIIREQKEFEKALKRERARDAFQREIAKRMKAEKKQLEEKQIKLKEREEELKYRKKKRDKAFEKLDEANMFLSQGKFEEALEIYYEVRNIFAQIQWVEELPLINQAIQEITEKKREKGLQEQKAINDVIKKEIEHASFLKNLMRRRKAEKQLELRRREKIESKQQELAKNREQEKKAFELIEEADISLELEEFDNALTNYISALEILEETGWKGEYLKILQETIDMVKREKKEENLKQEREIEKLKLIEQKNREFQQRLRLLMEKEQQRLQEKEIKIEEQRQLKEKQEEIKQKAFEIIDQAENFLENGEYETSVEKYREAELLLNEIHFPTELIKDTISKIKEQKRQEEIDKQREVELKLKREQEEKQLEQNITEQMKQEQEKMRAKQIELARQQQLEKKIEQERENAFELLDQAQKLIQNNDFDQAIEIYHRVAEIFKNINWEEESEMIRNSIVQIEQQKKEMEIKKVKELKQLLVQERQEERLKEEIRKEAQLKKQALEEQRKKREKEKKFEEQIEEKRKEAFIQLDLADEYLSKGNYEEAIEVYYDVANIFAEIQWNDEIPKIYDAIEEIRAKRNEKIRRKQEILKKKVEKEKKEREFIEKIQDLRKEQRQKELEKQELQQRQEQLTAQNRERQEMAFKIIQDADVLIENERYDEAIGVYIKAITILNEIGWEGPYLKVLRDTLEQIMAKKERKQIILQKEEERRIQSEKASEEFQRRVLESMNREQQRLQEKKIKIDKIKQIQQEKNELKEQAFEIIKKAEQLAENGEYEPSIKKFREAELILSQIHFPTTTIKERIQNIQEMRREEQFQKQKNLISALQDENKNEILQKQVSQRMKIDQKKLEQKRDQLRKREEFQKYVESQKEKAFDLLDHADSLTTKGNYDEALEKYRDAELILNEIQFPTEAIEEVIVQIKEKQRARDFERQSQLQEKIEHEQRENYFRRYMAKRMEEEKRQLMEKKIRVENFEARRQSVENKKKEAFELLDEAESLTQQEQFESAIEYYKKAQLILNQIHFPTDSIDEMINRVMEIEEEKQKERIKTYQRELEHIEKEKTLKDLMEKRKAQEAERKRAKQIALRERERLIQEQKSLRETAYSLLEKASEFLKRRTPDYDQAISLYVEARDLLAEKIGWEPEINNIDQMIQDLQEEKANFLEKQKKEEEIETQKEREYKEFIDEIRQSQREHMRQKKVRQLELLHLKEQQDKLEELRDAGLEYIEQGKKLASYQRFDQAYEMLNNALETFRFLGWKHQIRYIREEIARVHELELQAKEKEKQFKKSQKLKERQKRAEEFKRLKQERELKETVGEVGTITKDVSKLLEEQQIQEEIEKKQQKEQLIIQSRDFGKSMGRMIKLKEELQSQIEDAKERKEKEKKAREREQKRKEVDDIKKMLKDTAKKNKKTN